MIAYFLSKPKILLDLDEELFHCPLQITGVIPPWLRGTLVRNGPVNVSVDGQKNVHWLDGLAMLHAFSFDQGRVQYTNKFLRTDAYKSVFDRGSLNYQGFLNNSTQASYKKYFSKFFSRKPLLPNANANILQIDHQYVALAESPLPVKFDLHNLETLGTLDYQDLLPHENCWESAHPHYDKEKNELVNFLVELGDENFYIIYRIRNGTRQREVISKIPVQDPSYMHSFAVTKNYIILVEFPFFMRNMWDSSKGTTFLVIDRHNGILLKKYHTVAFFAFHHVNAFENEGNIYLDLICYDDASIIEKMADHNRATTEKENWALTRLVRFILFGEKILSDVLFKKFSEFPKINPQFTGIPYRYVYLTDIRDTLLINEIRPIYKVDVQTKDFIQWESEGCYPGESLFIAAPHAQEEEDGIVISIGFDAKNYHSFLLILDAKTLQEMCRAKIPHVIPSGLHSQFFDS